MLNTMVKINISTLCDKREKRDNYCEDVVIQAVREKNKSIKMILFSLLCAAS